MCLEAPPVLSQRPCHGRYSATGHRSQHQPTNPHLHISSPLRSLVTTSLPARRSRSRASKRWRRRHVSTRRFCCESGRPALPLGVPAAVHPIQPVSDPPPDPLPTNKGKRRRRGASFMPPRRMLRHWALACRAAPRTRARPCARSWRACKPAMTAARRLRGWCCVRMGAGVLSGLLPFSEICLPACFWPGRWTRLWWRRCFRTWTSGSGRRRGWRRTTFARLTRAAAT